jgi:hypothetical protein
LNNTGSPIVTVYGAVPVNLVKIPCVGESTDAVVVVVVDDNTVL